MNTEQLPGTAAGIACQESTSTDWTRRIASEVTVVLVDMFPQVSQDLVEHAVCETLTKISRHLRAGEPVAVEEIGVLMPREVEGRRQIDFHPDPVLFQPVPGATRAAFVERRRQREVAHG